MDSIAAALAAISDDELQALHAATVGAPAVVPGLQAWLEAAVDWAINDRAGFHYELLGPHAAIDDNEAAPSLLALAVLSARFGDGTPIADFLDV